MSEQLGVLKVIVVQGRRLVIRDFKTSDPYVVLKLGNQVTMIYIPFSSLLCLCIDKDTGLDTDMNWTHN